MRRMFETRRFDVCKHDLYSIQPDEDFLCNRFVTTTPNAHVSTAVYSRDTDGEVFLN
jgi:hypothetical protein